MKSDIFSKNNLNEGSIVFLSSYLPRECGLATFTADLVQAINNSYPHLATPVVAMDDEISPYRWPPEVSQTVRRNVFSDYQKAAQEINGAPVSLVNIQHEHGLFGGEDGDYILAFMEQTKKPIVTALHTVLANPSPHFREVTSRVCDLSAAVVVLAKAAIALLTEIYGVDASKICFIPHGVPTVIRKPGTRHGVKRLLDFPSRKIVTTFGLIGPSKGIEYALQALPTVIKHHPDLLYIILGETHPVLRRAEGEKYRNYLQEMVEELGLTPYVLFENRYLTLKDLVKYLLASHVYVMPYLNREQMVSGTLAYAVGVGKAIIATPFLYAEELLGDGRGIIVNFRDPDGIAQALMSLLWNPEQLYAMEERTYNYSHHMVWPSVAKQYMSLFGKFRKERPLIPVVPAWWNGPQGGTLLSAPTPVKPSPNTPLIEATLVAS